MLLDAIYELLKGVTADIYPNIADQEVNVPFVVHSKVRTDPTQNKDGDKNRDFVLYRMACYGNNSAEADQIAKDLKAVMNDYHGQIGGTLITNIRLVNEENGYEDEVGFFVVQTYRIIMGQLT